MAQTKYVTLSKLSIFLDNLANKFSLKSHTHKTEDILDYTVDDKLSVVSINPVQNKAVSDEFGVIRSVIEGVSNDINSYNDKINEKSQVQLILWEDND